MEESYLKLQKYLEELIPSKYYERLGAVFRTKRNMYVYDTGTGKVFSCNEIEYRIFESIFNNFDLMKEKLKNYQEEDIIHAIDSIIEVIKTENILQATDYKEFARETDQELNAVLNYSLQSLILEVTQKCNFRCKYCIYHDYNSLYRDYTAKDMSWETAKKTIDYVKAHCGEKDLSIAFYGGEPLINYDLIHDVIGYCKQIMSDKSLIFSFTTNLSLMDKNKAAFFAKEGCYIMCSIDGPSIIHDAYRVDAEGNGTFELVMQGLKNLIEAYGNDAEEKNSFNVVICPPYIKDKFDAIKDFFSQIEWLPPKLTIKYSYVESGSLREEDIDYTYFSKDERKNQVSEIAPVAEWTMNKLIDKSDTDYLPYSFARDALVRVHKRFLSDRPYEKMKRNGCCIPGGRRIYVDVDGNIALCERVGKCPPIGNIDTGIDINKIKKYYLEDYEKKSLDKCKNCWAVNLCNICYAACYREDGIDISSKNELCYIQRKQIKGELILYYEVMEEAPDVLANFEEIEVF